MHCISIQIQPEHISNFDQKSFLAHVKMIGRSPEIDDFQEKGKHYLQFNFFTERPYSLWQELTTTLYQNKDYGGIIGPVSIVICENEDSDEECLLLHHFDKNEKIDALK